MSEDVGGYGNRESSAVWFRYRAYRDDGAAKVPVGRLVRWVENTARALPYFDDGSAQAVAAISEKPVEGGEYDPFADE